MEANMALVKCPECGRKISDTTKNCIHCGYELSTKVNEQTQLAEDVKLSNVEPKKTVKKKAVFWSMIAVGGAIVICLVLFFAFGLGKYLQGAIAYSKGDYKSAVQLLSESEYTLDKNKLPNAKVALAKDYITSEDWQNAYDLLKDVKIEEAVNVLPEVKYNLAINHINAKEWDEAIELLTGLQYKDSEAVLENATRNKGMSENADFEFLAAFQEAVYRRIEISESNNFTYSDLVNAETSRLEKFKNSNFYDSELQKLTMDYLGGLDKQESALKKSHSEYQILWQEGIVERYNALVALADKYELFQDRPNFVQEYYANDLPEVEEYLKALKSADTDFKKQFSDSTWKKINGYQISVTYTNYTGYTLDQASVYVFYYDKNGTRVGDASCYFENVKFGQTTICEFYVSNSRNIQRCEFSWEFLPHVD